MLCQPLDRQLTVVYVHLLRLAAFHFAQRARWAAAIRLRAAADMVLRFLATVGTPVELRFGLTSLPRTFKAVSNPSTSLRARSLSFFNCPSTVVRLSMVPLGQALYQRVRG